MSGTYQHREGFGSLFANRDKAGDNHPDMKGDAMFNGAIVEVAAWKKTTAGGKEYLSLKIGLKRQQGAQPEAPRQEMPRQAGGGNLDDDIPFSAGKE